MNTTFASFGQPFSFNFSAALGLAQQAHDISRGTSGADVFSQLKLDRASVARELPSLACTPAAAPRYTSVPNWKVWQDF
jgi:hypothetical protein